MGSWPCSTGVATAIRRSHRATTRSGAALSRGKPELAPPSGSGGVSHPTDALPVPWQQRREVGDLVIGDTCEHVCKPGLRINVVELASLHEREHDRGTLTAAIGAGEQPRPAPQSNSSERALGGIVGQADPAVLKKACECID